MTPNNPPPYHNAPPTNAAAHQHAPAPPPTPPKKSPWPWILGIGCGITVITFAGCVGCTALVATSPEFQKEFQKASRQNSSPSSSPSPSDSPSTSSEGTSEQSNPAGQASSDPIQEDLIAYINSGIKPLVQQETEATSDYESVVGANYTNDAETLQVIRDKALPKYRDLVEKLEAIQPQTTEVREIHESYVAAANEQLNGMVQIVAAIERQDTSLIAEANDRLAKGRRGAREFQVSIQELARKHNVQILSPAEQ